MRYFDELKIVNERLREALARRGELLKELERELRAEMRKLPPELLNVHRIGGRAYFSERAPGAKGEKYIKKDDTERIAKLAQREYLQYACVWASAEQRSAAGIGEAISAPEDYITGRMLPEKLALADPIYLTDEEYAKKWMSFSYTGRGFREGDPPGYVTATGVRVRSRAEALIGDRLTLLGIPYRYECPLRVGNHIIYPDFTCLCIKERREVRLEHLGLLGDPKYLKDAIAKINAYEKAGYRQGIDIIYTFESDNEMLDMAMAECLIRTHILMEEPGAAKKSAAG